MGKTTRKIGRLAKLGALSSKVSGSYLSQKYVVLYNLKRLRSGIYKIRI